MDRTDSTVPVSLSKTCRNCEFSLWMTCLLRNRKNGQWKRPEKLEQKDKRRNGRVDPLKVARCLQERNASYRGDACVSSTEGQLRGAAHAQTDVAMVETNGAFGNRVQQVDSVYRAR